MGATPLAEELVFLLTDIEGSTRLWEDQAEAMPAALARHNVLVETAIAEHNGQIFKAMGDGFFAVFAEPAAALAAAVAAQRALVTTDWGDLGLTQHLTVRMALHAGSATTQNGDYTGPTLNRTARLLAAGHGSQILLFATLAGRIFDLPDGVTYRDLGERRLRDVPGSERILQIVAPGLPAAFPPLRALDPAPHNLPTPPTDCIGRETELEQLRAHFLQSNARLVTLTGPGGIGKTRLALQLAFDLLDTFPGGAWFIDLSTIRENDQVAGAVIRALGIADYAGRNPEEVLRSWLNERRLLLVIDNCEQVVDACARLAAMIGRDLPESRMLATSRTPLGIRGELLFPVEPLPLPDETVRSTMTSVASAPSVQLFVARASSARPSFTLTPANASAIAGVCRQVEGIPLALELAAARVVMLSPEALRERLDRRLPALATGARDLPARQQTLHAAIAWSYELLEPGVRATFAHLAVFAGGWTLSSAQMVLGHLSEASLEEHLTILVSHSLLRIDPDAPDEARFTMLETIREFALEQLQALGHETDLREAHAGYFLSLSTAAAPHLLSGPDQLLWMERIDREHQNLRTAALWWLDRESASRVLELCSNIWQYWSVRGGAREGSELIRRALASGAGIAPALRAGALRKFGNLSIAVGDTRTAKTLYEESHAIEVQASNRAGIADCLIDLGMVATMQGRIDDFPGMLSEAAEILHELGDLRGEATALFNAAIGWRDFGDLDTAERLFGMVLTIQEELSDAVGIAWTWLSLGRIACDRGDTIEAMRLATEALAIFVSAIDEEAVASANELIASVERANGNHDRARVLLTASLETHERRNDLQKMAESLEALAFLYYVAGQRDDASRSLTRAAHLRDQSGCPVPRIDAPALAQLSHDVGHQQSPAASPGIR